MCFYTVPFSRPYLVLSQAITSLPLGRLYCHSFCMSICVLQRAHNSLRFTAHSFIFPLFELLQATISRHVMCVDDLQQQLAEAQETIQALDVQVASLQAEVAQVQSSRAEALEARAHLADEIATIQNAQAALRASHAEVESQLASTRQASDEQLAAEQRKHRQELVDLKV